MIEQRVRLWWLRPRTAKHRAWSASGGGGLHEGFQPRQVGKRGKVDFLPRTPGVDRMTLEDAVWVDPDRMSGAPCFRGSRLPVQQLFDWLADGVPLEEFIEDFRIDRAAAQAVLRAAGAQLCQRRLRAGAEDDTA